ncbi:uncharacterized protein LOC128883469 isoform X2 [Hylaeus volcanicus]|uniref:uncharacterized protein LOC128883469 isoform X2 n=1 Tax=Hylaeus volcanicus TaxID=313075 RepID=UPI0023B873A2|nr:uncharacterized protein LOC128883469 isoform X2 [Hylaeus volcanicus]
MDKSSYKDGQADSLPTEVFGWNPYSHTSQNEYNHQAIEEPLPRWAQSNHEIMQLTDLYQQQLAELASTHTLLMNDQKAFATAMEPFVEKDGTFRVPPDEKWIFIKRGLDLRLLEFEEDCRRIQQTERHLQRKIDDCTLTYETSLIEARGYAETRLIEQIQEQQKLIEYQQHELDELRFQRDLYSDETSRLRQICRFGTYSRPSPAEVAVNRVERIPLPTRRTLHKQYCSEKPPFVWMQKIRHSQKIKKPQRKKQEEMLLKIPRTPVTKSSSVTHSWISTPSKNTKKVPPLPLKSKTPPKHSYVCYNSFVGKYKKPIR